MENLNSPEYLDKTKGQLLDILRQVRTSGTQIQTGQVQSQLNPRGVNMEVDRPNPDEEGNPVVEGFNYDRLTAVLTKALQEAITKIETLEAKVEALESA